MAVNAAGNRTRGKAIIPASLPEMQKLHQGYYVRATLASIPIMMLTVALAERPGELPCTEASETVIILTVVPLWPVAELVAWQA